MKDLNEITVDIASDGSYIDICQGGVPTGYYLALALDRLVLHNDAIASYEEDIKASTTPSYADGAADMWNEP